MAQPSRASSAESPVDPEATSADSERPGGDAGELPLAMPFAEPRQAEPIAKGAETTPVATPSDALSTALDAEGDEDSGRERPPAAATEENALADESRDDAGLQATAAKGGVASERLVAAEGREAETPESRGEPAETGRVRATIGRGPEGKTLDSSRSDTAAVPKSEATAAEPLAHDASQASRAGRAMPRSETPLSRRGRTERGGRKTGAGEGGAAVRAAQRSPAGPGNMERAAAEAQRAVVRRAELGGESAATVPAPGTGSDALARSAASVVEPGQAGTPAQVGTPRTASPLPVALDGLASDSATFAPEPSEAVPSESPEKGNATAVDRARMVQRVAHAFRRLDSEGGQVRILMQPPELGSVRAELRMRGNRMEGRLVAQSESAGGVLRENLPELRERLAEMGVQLERLEIEVDEAPHRGSAGPGGDPRDRQRSDDAVPGGRSRRDKASGEPAAAAPSTRQALAAAVAAAGGLDLVF